MAVKYNSLIYLHIWSRCKLLFLHGFDTMVKYETYKKQEGQGLNSLNDLDSINEFVVISVLKVCYLNV